MSKDDDVERLLARGRVSGSRLDRIWHRIEPHVSPSAHVPGEAAKRSWTLWFVLATAPIILVIFFLSPLMLSPDKDKDFRPRGTMLEPIVEATCGLGSAPCRLGESLYLRITADPAQRTAYLQVADGQIYGPFKLKTNNTTPIPIAITPDTADLARGISVALWLLEKPIEEHQLLKLPDSVRVTIEVAE